MKYQVVHRTLYTYEAPVTVSHHVARLTPRTLPHQTCPWHDVDVSPQPVVMSPRVDAFGNQTLYFEQAGSYTQLEVTARSWVRVEPAAVRADTPSPAWETVREATAADVWSPATAAGEFRHASPLIAPHDVFATYARTSFTPRRPVLEAALELNHRIFSDFAFDPVATDVATPVREAFERRRGVCQDFAQVMIACLRSVGLPARYVSGYLETLPPPGQEKLVGADASHAWVSVFCGESLGWIDLDPTNDLQPAERHITVAWGRDFHDVSPLRGVTWGPGEQWLLVGVDVTRMD